MDTVTQGVSDFWDWLTTPTGSLEDFLPKSKTIDTVASAAGILSADFQKALEGTGAALQDLEKKIGWAILIFAVVLALLLFWFVFTKLT